FKSTTAVPGPARPRISSLEPTAMMRSPPTASASARGRAGSPAHTSPFTNTRSGGTAAATAAGAAGTAARSNATISGHAHRPPPARPSIPRLLRGPSLQCRPGRHEVDETRAWACLMANILVLPGLGSLIAGRRSGWPQAAGALGGFALTLVWLGWVVGAWSRTGSFPLAGGPYLPEGLGGAML